ncbi:MAG: glycyl-radical enzyme activating protein [Christensenellales bacterium]|jgi:glycyl-radical enzyme activating protein
MLSNPSMKGRLFNIQRFSVHDGPGIRTSVFLKGCPLRCLWCHNPEGISTKPVISYDARKCAACSACTRACPARHSIQNGQHIYDRAGCNGCGACAEACLFGALELAGYERTVGEVMDTVRRDAPFYRGVGGLTITGGEPTLQSDFSTALAAAARAEGISVCVETCGYCPEHTLRTLAAYTDLFLFDIKETDAARHKAYTGVNPAPIIANLRALDAAGQATMLRCPIIPGFNDRLEHMEGIANIANTLSHARGIELMPYHPLGQGKAERFGLTPNKSLPEHAMPRKDVEALLAYLQTRTDVPVKAG